MVYSYDGESTGSDSHPHLLGRSLHVQRRLSQADNTVYIATFFPFTYTEMSGYHQLYRSIVHTLTTSLLGQSEQGRDIKLVKITNSAIPESQKETIYIIGTAARSRNMQQTS